MRVYRIKSILHKSAFFSKENDLKNVLDLFFEMEAYPFYEITCISKSYDGFEITCHEMTLKEYENLPEFIGF